MNPGVQCSKSKCMNTGSIFLVKNEDYIDYDCDLGSIGELILELYDPW